MDREERQTLIATFGICEICGAPRNVKKGTMDDHEFAPKEGWGKTTYFMLICTADKSHKQGGEK